MPRPLRKPQSKTTSTTVEPTEQTTMTGSLFFRVSIIAAGSVFFLGSLLHLYHETSWFNDFTGSAVTSTLSHVVSNRTSAQSNGHSSLRNNVGLSLNPQQQQSTGLSKHRKALYRYIPPYTRTKEQIKSAKAECGEGPEFAQFFAQSGDLHSRSPHKEDQTIWNLFFKNANANYPHTYVEIGGYNGKSESNSRFFDECLHWEGLLVEANPRTYPQMVTNRPHVHKLNFAPSCSAAEERQNKTVAFANTIWTNAAQLKETQNAYSNASGVAHPSVEEVQVPCGTFTPALLEVFPHGHISFFSLDVEGAEPLVLEQIDFNQVHIDIMIVESWNMFCQAQCETRDKARAIMAKAGYKRFEGKVMSSDLYVHNRSRFIASVM